jgi:hypothetical protein
MTPKEIWLVGLAAISKEYPFTPKRVEKRNIEGQLHSEIGPAVTTSTFCSWYFNGRKHGLYVDIFGSKVYYYNNVIVPSHYITDPKSVTVDEILNHPNQEVRYAGLEIYGFERMIQEGHFKVVHHDKNIDARLLRFEKNLQEPLCLVQVTNASPEIDGHYKKYFLKVPPTIKTCKEAIAWTFGVAEKDYHPDVET